MVHSLLKIMAQAYVIEAANPAMSKSGWFGRM
jgi:hypothetical protein